MRQRDEGADGKARVGAEGSEERTQVGGVREFKWGEKGMGRGRGKRRRWVSSRQRCVSVLIVWVDICACVLIALVGVGVGGSSVVSDRNLTTNGAHLD